LKKFIEPVVPDAEQFVSQLGDFVHTEAKLPALDRNYLRTDPIEIPVDQSREQIVDYLQTIRSSNSTADLAFYAYRDMQACDWDPFVKASAERNPVSIRMTNQMSIDEVYIWLAKMNNSSIYNGKRLAQPDEVANYQTSDGLEKAFLIANVIRQRNPEQDIEITVDNNDVIVKAPNEYRFVSDKGLKKQLRMS
jgi:hypothetical protein